MKIEKTDVLVIGAGPAGTVAASIIKQAGFNVRIVEKLLFPRFVIGESLLPRCMEALEEAKFLDAVKSKGFQEKFGAKFIDNGAICDFTFADQYTKGWSWTWQVQRGEFDKTLADAAQSMDIPIDYETSVVGIEFHGSDSVTTIENANREKSLIQAKFIIDGSGYGRVIPGLFNLDRPSDLKTRKALFTHVKDVNRSGTDEPNRITIIVHKPGIWIWVIPFSNGVTSIGFVGELAFFNTFSGTLDEQMRTLINSEPELKKRFENTEYVFEPKSLESWSKTTEKFYGDGFVLTGNVTEFLDPIFSSGVTLAVTSSQLGAHLVIRKLQGEEVNWEKEYTEIMMQGINTFRTFVYTWYDGVLGKIFFSKNQKQEIKNQICSVLAGYVWDTSNPFVSNTEKAIKNLIKVIEFDKSYNSNE